MRLRCFFFPWCHLYYIIIHFNDTFLVVFRFFNSSLSLNCRKHFHSRSTTPCLIFHHINSPRRTTLITIPFSEFHTSVLFFEMYKPIPIPPKKSKKKMPKSSSIKVFSYFTSITFVNFICCKNFYLSNPHH